MNDQTPNSMNPEEEKIAQKLSRVAEQTHASAQFAAELEERLRKAPPSKTGWLVSAFRQISPALRWAVLMILLAVGLSWSIRTLIPTPQPAAETTPTGSVTITPTSEAINNQTATPLSPEERGYDWRGTKLYLGTSLPESPDTAHVYVLNKTEQATQEQAQALANQLGIQGEVYTAPGLIYGTTDYLISDGKQSLQVHSDKYFSYTADMSKSYQASSLPTNPNAEAIIREFLNSHGFDFPLQVYPLEFSGGYVVQPLAPDSIPMQYESFTPPMMRIVLDESGQVLNVDTSLMNYDPTPVGEYGIITAQEAFDKMLDDYVVTGKIESMHSGARMPKEWYREYPDNQPLTTYGYLSSRPAVDPGKPPLILIGGVPVVGNTTGLESLEEFTYIQATGQYFIENGIRKFNVELWDRRIQEAYLSGTLHRDGDQIILTSDDGSEQQYALIDPPADVPLDTKVPDSQLSVSGVLVDGKMFWTYIQFFETFTGGGGGAGGGLGFYKLNLSGPPVPFPSPTPSPDVNTGAIEYVVQENDTLASIALNFGVTVDVLMQANGITENVVFTGQKLMIPSQQAADNQLTGTYKVKEGDTCSAIATKFRISIESIIDHNQLSADCLISIGQILIISPENPVVSEVENLRGYLSISIHNKSDGTSTKEYNLEVIQEIGSGIYTMEGPLLGELDIYNQLPILITGMINSSGKLVVESYKIPYPDLHFQVLKGTQRIEQLNGQNVVIFTTEDGQSYVEFIATNNIPNEGSLIGYQGDLLEQEVLVIPDETFGGMPVAHIYQRSIVQEGASAMEVKANRITVYNEPDDPLLSPDYAPPSLMIDRVELVYFVSNPYYQVNDPNYSQRSTYIQPVWHFHGRYEDGGEFDALIQALKQEFLLPELVPHAGVG